MTKTNDPLEYFKDLVDMQGCAASTVKDGHVLMFTRKFLQEILDKNPGQEKIILFVKRPDFKD